MKASSMISVMISVVLGVIVLIAIKSVLSSIDTTNYSETEKALLSILPIITTAAIILGAFSSISAPIETISRSLMWESLGNRMKAAYSAKFGGNNPAFSEEVDQHIKAVKALGKGYTKSLDIDWFKRMTKFVEIPFIVPEEEYKTEEEKTRSFNDVL